MRTGVIAAARAMGATFSWIVAGTDGHAVQGGCFVGRETLSGHKKGADHSAPFEDYRREVRTGLAPTPAQAGAGDGKAKADQGHRAGFGHAGDLK